MYDRNSISTAFVPTERHGLQPPSQCFLQDSPFQLPVVIASLGEHAAFLGIEHKPPISKVMTFIFDINAYQILQRLLEDPPKNIEKSRILFEYLADRADEFTTSNFESIRNAAILPVSSPDPQVGTVLLSPAQVFLPSGISDP